MKVDYEEKLSRRAKNTNSSAIHELLKVLSQPGMVSLAGGMPDPATFPIDLVKKLSNEVIDKYGTELFQYGITEGFEPLRDAVAEYVKGRGIETSADDVYISTGAQTAIDAAAKILIDEGDTVLVEAPTFLATLKGFKLYYPNLVSAPVLDDGIDLDAVENALTENKNVKFLYVIPNFQNPSGISLSLEKRKRLAKIAIESGLLIVEDDPYHELRYTGKNLPTLKELAPENVIYIGSLSKVLSPGMRVGYFIAPKRFGELMTSVRQASDVHTNLLSQAIAAEYIAEGHIHKQIPQIREIYGKKLKTMLDLLKKHFTDSVKWSRPEGGMFVWLIFPDGYDVKELYKRALEAKVAFVPGAAFFAEPEKHGNTARLNFTNIDLEKIEDAIVTIAKLI